MRTNVPPVEDSLTLWRKDWCGADWRQGGQNTEDRPAWERRWWPQVEEGWETETGEALRALLAVEWILSGL